MQDMKSVRQRLDEELGEVQFDSAEHILSRTHPRKIGDRLRAYWNRELSIPLVPVALAAVLLLSMPILSRIDWQGESDTPTSSPSRQLIESGGSTYWNDDYEKVARRYANHDEN